MLVADADVSVVLAVSLVRLIDWPLHILLLFAIATVVAALAMVL